MDVNDPLRPPDEANPYTAPRAELTPRLPGAGYPAEAGWVEPFSIGAVLSRSWAVFRENAGTTMAAVIGPGVLSFLYNQAGTLLVSLLRDAGGAAQGAALGVWFVTYVLLVLWLQMGQTVVLLGLARGRSVSANELFHGGRYIVRYTLASLLLLVALIPVMFLAGVLFVAGVAAMGSVQDPVARVIIVVIGIILAVLVYLMVLLRLYLYPYVLVDRDCGPIAALSGAIEVTRGHVGELFVLLLLAGLVGFSGVLLCVVGLFVTVPLSVLMMAVTYVLLAGPAGPVYGKPPAPGFDALDAGP